MTISTIQSWGGTSTFTTELHEKLLETSINQRREQNYDLVYWWSHLVGDYGDYPMIVEISRPPWLASENSLR